MNYNWDPIILPSDIVNEISQGSINSLQITSNDLHFIDINLNLYPNAVVGNYFRPVQESDSPLNFHDENLDNISLQLYANKNRLIYQFLHNNHPINNRDVKYKHWDNHISTMKIKDGELMWLLD
jgi:hypothetical protein